MNAIDALRTWAELGRLHRKARPKQRANWKAVQRLIGVARPKLAAEGKVLQKLLDESRRRLDPFGDPFDVDLGLNRWLSADREESYSDWLHWIVEQLGNPILSYRMFKLDAPTGMASWPVSPIVERERFVASGHDGCAGRLDLVIRYPGHAIIVVEVKKGSAEDADILKQAGYAKWLGEQRESNRHSVLLVTDSQENTYEGFTPLPWSHLCVFLRQLAAKRLENLGHTAIALILAFVGAVEQNLLHMNASHVRRVAKGESWLLNPQIVDHLGESLRTLA